MDVLQLKAREARKPIVIVKSGHRQPTTSAMDDIAFRDGNKIPPKRQGSANTYFLTSVNKDTPCLCPVVPWIGPRTLPIRQSNRSTIYSLLFDTTGVSGSQRNYIMRFRPGILATGEPELRSPSAAASCNQGDRDIMRKNLNFLALCHPFPARAWRTGPGI
ncbi:hypothetical protein D8B26_007068 [Coccidioides posadasii str. Silveira]|uniref:Predicted protein n=1 Tax=Coccidioides posadasii (strain RMSCC 757 / Silveira) TaxID=443226 RepID=E9DJS3_COCPS|nr:predicted protein [Coccidioides posadasii str. Silveira]QVM12439.1 hypothetical protein D8B26_007068 [Coccidioides posadasii str. Silveira]